MKKRILITVSAVASLSILASSASGMQPRRAQLDYATNPNNVTVGGPEPTEVAGTADMSQLYIFEPKKGERFVTIDIQDDNDSVDVAGVVSQWVMDSWHGEKGGTGAGTGHAVTYQRFCNETKVPVRLKPRIEVRVSIQAGTCADGTPSTPTSGTITADFFRR